MFLQWKSNKRPTASSAESKSNEKSYSSINRKNYVWKKDQTQNSQQNQTKQLNYNKYNLKTATRRSFTKHQFSLGANSINDEKIDDSNEDNSSNLFPDRSKLKYISPNYKR